MGIRVMEQILRGKRSEASSTAMRLTLRSVTEETWLPFWFCLFLIDVKVRGGSTRRARAAQSLCIRGI